MNGFDLPLFEHAADRTDRDGTMPGARPASADVLPIVTAIGQGAPTPRRVRRRGHRPRPPELLLTCPARTEPAARPEVSAGSRIPTALEPRPAVLPEALEILRRRGDLAEGVFRRMRSDLAMAHKICRNGDRTAAALPCDPRDLRPLLEGANPARYNMKPRRWSAVRSSVNRVLRLVGWLEPGDATEVPLPANWECGRLSLGEPGQCAMFAAFARYCTTRGISPADVSETTVQSYFAWRQANTLELRARDGTAALFRVWNAVVATDPDWPGRSLRKPARHPRQSRLDDSHYPDQLLKDIEAYMARRAAPPPFDRTVRRRYSLVTNAHCRGSLLRAASVLLRANRPVETLAALLQPGAVEFVLTEHYNRVGKGVGWAPSAVTFAADLKAAATHCLDPEDPARAKTIALCERVGKGKIGLAESNLGKLAQFDDPDMIVRFYALPAKLFDEAETMAAGGSHMKGARLYLRALALAILHHKPLRRANLARLDLDAHFRRDGRGDFTTLLIPASESKNGRPIESALTQELSKRLRRYAEHFRPLLRPDGSALFPGGGGHGAIRPDTLAREISRLVERELGVKFNIHLIRHLAATLLLDDNPANAPVVQRMLDHGNARTSARFYGGAATRGAQQVYAAALTRKVADARKARRP